MTAVCIEPGCPKLRPCPTHGTPSNAPRSPWRNRGDQARFRRSVLQRDRFTCTRCGHIDPTGHSLDAHHVRDGYDVGAGVTLCNSQANGCHAAVDRFAR